MKYAMSYLVIFAVVLVLLNTYPVAASQDLLFTSKRDSLKSQTAVMASALMELESLSADQVARVMNMLDSMGLTRILVTDPAGLVLYDSNRPAADEPAEGEEPPPPEYRYALYQEVVSALRGSDVFYSRYNDRVFTSTAAMPIVYRGMVIGSIYILEIDSAQGELLFSLQQNLRNISLVIAAVTLVMSAFFSKMLTTRIAALLRAIRIVGEGEYGHRLQPVGRDELAQLAGEFNHLTDRLQTTEEVRRRFVSDASHELKTPLASIRLLADSILQTDEMDPAMVRDFVTDIGSEAERLTRITEHLLSLTKLDSLPAGEQLPVDVSQVLERTVALLQPVADASRVTVERELRPDCVILCTEDDLFQISFNLVENAIKYNYPGGRVFVSVYRDRDQVLLEVGDTGVGIPEEDLPKVFNRFYRVDKARSRAAGGTGLGLSIVRDTIRRHGGWVTARPRSPEGSLFTAGFPRYVPEERGKGETE
ncbi:sensor histidine kinase [Colidextribacter sp. OB.20]|nr:sensor histidine kinase [Colidextribacter sp. OB.20]